MWRAWKWISLKWISWQWLYNHKFLNMSLEAQRRALKVDLQRITDLKEREGLESLLNQAASADSGTAEGLVLFVQRHHYLSAGAGQVVLPVVGLSVFGLLVLLLAIASYKLPEAITVTIERELVGVSPVTFFGILIAGSAGGSIRVLLTSLGRGHLSRSVPGLTFTGFLWPAVGAVLGLILVEAF